MKNLKNDGRKNALLGRFFSIIFCGFLGLGFFVPTLVVMALEDVFKGLSRSNKLAELVKYQILSILIRGFFLFVLNAGMRICTSTKENLKSME